MAYGKVLAVVTGSSSDNIVVAQASELVRPVKGTLFAIYVIQVDRSRPVDAEIPHAVERGETVLQRAEDIANLPRGDLVASLLQARTIGPAVVSEASARGVDVVVMGTQYPMAYGSFCMDDSALYLLEHAPCLVMLMRQPRRPTRERGENGTSGPDGATGIQVRRVLKGN